MENHPGLTGYIQVLCGGAINHDPPGQSLVAWRATSCSPLGQVIETCGVDQPGDVRYP